MTIDRTRDPLGRLPVADDDGPACGATHYWSGWTCQAEPDHDGKHRVYMDGAHAEWREFKSAVVVTRP